MTKRNLKIAITPEQPLDEVVRELERLGYKKDGWIGYRNTSFITTCKLGFYTDHAISFWSVFGDSPLTTLTELKEME
nr:MAG TPA: hypothetical protein [Caudoviricetes sp.]